jgi:Na+/H+ antiporter NhaC
VTATPYIKVTPAATGDTFPDTVTVTCTLAAGPSTTSTTTQSATVKLTNVNDSANVSLPLTVIAPESANSITSAVSCLETPSVTTDAPVVTAQSTIYALNVNPTTATS